MSGFSLCYFVLTYSEDGNPVERELTEKPPLVPVKTSSVLLLLPQMASEDLLQPCPVCIKPAASVCGARHELRMQCRGISLGPCSGIRSDEGWVCAFD